MKLLEYEAKNIFESYNISVPQGGIAESPTQAKKVAARIGGPIVIKAQIPVAGRGKAGGILFSSSPEEAEFSAKKLLNSKVKGFKVCQVLVEKRALVKKELFFGVTVDRSKRCYVAIASSMGGMDIEQVASSSPKKIHKYAIDPIEGFHLSHALRLVSNLGYSELPENKLAKIFLRLHKVAMDFDAELVEINPLVETLDNKFIAADAKLIIDDNSLFRHPRFSRRKLFNNTELSFLELKAKQMGVSYVKLKGNIGVIGNGAGLVMATLDMITLYGGIPANFLDVGGGASADSIASAINLVSSDPDVAAVFINILGGITRCDDVARGIVQTRTNIHDKLQKPMVVRLVGTNEEEGRQILMENGIAICESMEEAAQKIVKMLKGGA